MTLSVLMSVYYKETDTHLDRSLKSVWEQTRQPDQIVLVEDGPLTDDLYRVINKWKSIFGERMVTPRNETNLGLTAALNMGLEYVTSDLVARNDSDDISAPDRFELQIQYLEEHNDIDVIGGAMQEFNDTDPCLGVRFYPSDNIREYICKASPIAHPTAVMRMRIFKEGLLRYDPRYPLNEDIALWFDVLRKGYNISNLQSIVYYFNCSDGLYDRRSHLKAGPEFLVYFRGIRDLFGIFTWRYIYPILRWCFRMMPIFVIQKIYKSGLRRYFLKQQT